MFLHAPGLSAIWRSSLEAICRFKTGVPAPIVGVRYSGDCENVAGAV